MSIIGQLSQAVILDIPLPEVFLYINKSDKDQINSKKQDKNLALNSYLSMLNIQQANQIYSSKQELIVNMLKVIQKHHQKLGKRMILFYQNYNKLQQFLYNQNNNEGLQLLEQLYSNKNNQIKQDKFEQTEAQSIEVVQQHKNSSTNYKGKKKMYNLRKLIKEQIMIIYFNYSLQNKIPLPEILECLYICKQQYGSQLMFQLQQTKNSHQQMLLLKEFRQLNIQLHILDYDLNQTDLQILEQYKMNLNQSPYNQQQIEQGQIYKMVQLIFKNKQALEKRIWQTINNKSLIKEIAQYNQLYKGQYIIQQLDYQKICLLLIELWDFPKSFSESKEQAKIKEVEYLEKQIQIYKRKQSIQKQCFKFHQINSYNNQKIVKRPLSRDNIRKLLQILVNEQYPLPFLIKYFIVRPDKSKEMICLNINLELIETINSTQNIQNFLRNYINQNKQNENELSDTINITQLDTNLLNELNSKKYVSEQQQIVKMLQIINNHKNEYYLDLKEIYQKYSVILLMYQLRLGILKLKSGSYLEQAYVQMKEIQEFLQQQDEISIKKQECQ